MESDLSYTLVGLLIGATVGITGVGGGSLMTPILITVFGISPATAVGTDLLFAAATNSVGSLVNGVNHRIDWRIVFRLAAGSLPSTVLALSLLYLLHMSIGGARHLITATLMLALFLTALTLLFRGRITAFYQSRFRAANKRWTGLLTVVIGAVVGALVTLSSVGAGVIGGSALMLAYPELSAAQIVASDLAHSVPLTLIAGIAHGGMGSLDFPVLIMLLSGSLPGIFIGSMISARVPKAALRYVLAVALVAAGGRLAMQMRSAPHPLTARAVPIQGNVLDTVSYSPASTVSVPHPAAGHPR